MPASTGAIDETLAGGYFDLALSGLETVKFADLSGLRHTVPVTNKIMNTKASGKIQEIRVLGPPEAVDLTCTYVVLKAKDIWTWLDLLIEKGASDTTAKEGSLFIKSIANNEIVATWKLSQVFLTNLSLPQLGSNASEFLIANLTITVGECAPM